MDFAEGVAAIVDVMGEDDFVVVAHNYNFARRAARVDAKVEIFAVIILDVNALRVHDVAVGEPLTVLIIILK